MTFDELRAMALALPQVEESTSYESPAFRIRKRLIARLHDDGESVVLKVDPVQRDALLATRPDRFFVTPHYEEERSWILTRLEDADPEEVAELLAAAWRRLAPPRIVQAFEAGEFD